MDPDFALQRYALKQAEIDFHADRLTEITKSIGDILEGNYFTNHQTTIRNEELILKRINLLEVARHGKKILELGFNAGHSALLFVLGCEPDAEVDFFDIGFHAYVRPCFNYIQSISPVKTSLTLANSLHHLPKLVLKEGQQNVYDIIHMDGGHSRECVVNDLLLLYMLLKPGGILIVDDADGFILEEVSLFISLGLVEVLAGQFPTKVYPHIIVKKV
jgi:predicted O-methyltransferase YrrM